jgi:hypothetical protein
VPLTRQIKQAAAVAALPAEVPCPSFRMPQDCVYESKLGLLGKSHKSKQEQRLRRLVAAATFKFPGANTICFNSIGYSKS